MPSGIRHNTTLLWVKAARWHGYRFLDEWCALDGDDQAFLLASYLTVMQCEAVEIDQKAKEKS